jgi:hypothetical protein
MLVEVHWRSVTGPRDVAWGWRGVLYAYLHPNREVMLYIGLAHGRTVRQRWTYATKARVWDCMERLGVTRHICLVGELALDDDVRLTRQLLNDVETLLIKRVQPRCNKSAKGTRIRRPGLRVRCIGGWNGWRSEYRDV